MVRQIRFGQIEPVEARGTGVKPAEAIAPALDCEKRLNLSIDKELISEDAIAVSEVEGHQAIVRIEVFVIEHHWNVEIWKAGKAKSGCFISSVKLIKKEIETSEAFVDILRREVHAVVVIPERAHRFVDVAVGWMARRESSQGIGIVLVVPFVLTEEVTGEPVTFRWCMAIVQVSGDRLYAEPSVVIWQVVEVSDEDRFAVASHISLTGDSA